MCDLNTYFTALGRGYFDIAECKRFLGFKCDGSTTCDGLADCGGKETLSVLECVEK